MFNSSLLNQTIFWDSLAVLISIMLLKPLAHYLKLVDHPGGRKAIPVGVDSALNSGCSHTLT